MGRGPPPHRRPASPVAGKWRMKHFTAILFVAALAAQVPEKDARLNTSAGTKFEYAMPQYASRAEWEQRREHLRKQILAAAGLLPLPVRRPAHAEIFGKISHEGYS